MPCLPSPRRAGRRACPGLDPGWREAPDEGRSSRCAKKHRDRPVPTTRPSIGRSPRCPRHRVLPWRTVCFGVVSGAGVNQPDPNFRFSLGQSMDTVLICRSPGKRSAPGMNDEDPRVRFAYPGYLLRSDGKADKDTHDPQLQRCKSGCNRFNKDAEINPIP